MRQRESPQRDYYTKEERAAYNRWYKTQNRERINAREQARRKKVRAQKRAESNDIGIGIDAVDPKSMEQVTMQALDHAEQTLRRQKNGK